MKKIKQLLSFIAEAARDVISRPTCWLAVCSVLRARNGASILQSSAITTPLCTYGVRLRIPRYPRPWPACPVGPEVCLPSLGFRG